jgi:hypothetical protein
MLTLTDDILGEVIGFLPVKIVGRFVLPCNNAHVHVEPADQ